MSWLDFAILVIIGLSALVGWRLGIIRMALAVAGAMVGLWLGGQLGEGLGERLDLTDNPDGASVLGFVIVFGLALVVASLLSSALRRVVGPFPLPPVDSGGGAALGAVGSTMAAAVLLVAASALPSESIGRTIDNSGVASFLAKAAPSALNVLPERFEDVLASVVRGEDVEQPTVAVEKVVIAGGRASAPTRVDIHIVVDNPNAFGGFIRGTVYQIDWERDSDSTFLGRTTAAAEQRLGARSETRLELPLKVLGLDEATMRALSRQFQAEDGVRLMAEGEVQVEFQRAERTALFKAAKVAQAPS